MRQYEQGVEFSDREPTGCQNAILKPRIVSFISVGGLYDAHGCSAVFVLEVKSMIEWQSHHDGTTVTSSSSNLSIEKSYL